MKVWLVVQEESGNQCHAWHVAAREKPGCPGEDWRVVRCIGEIPDTDDEQVARVWWPALDWIE